MTTPLLASAQFASDRGFGMGREGRFDGHPWIGVLCMALFVGAVVFLVIWALGRGRGMHPAHPAPHAPVATSTTANAEAILAERLARGEIAPDDYRASLAALRGDAPGAPQG